MVVDLDCFINLIITVGRCESVFEITADSFYTGL